MKYALLDNNQIKVGPRDWNKGFWDRYLEEVDVKSNLPWTYNDQEVITVNDNIKIVPVAEPVTPSYNARTEQLAGPYWDVTQTPITGYYDVADQNLDAAKNNLKAEVAVNRYNQETVGTKITIQGTEVAVGTSRGQDREVWYQNYIVMGDSDTLRFKFAADVWKDLTKTDVKSIIDAINAHVQAAFAWESDKIVEIDAAVDKSALEAIEVAYPEVV